MPRPRLPASPSAALAEGFVCTDPATPQFVRVMGGGVFHVIDRGQLFVVDVRALTSAQVADAVAAYYGDVDGLLRDVPDAAAREGIIAECIAEQDLATPVDTSGDPAWGTGPRAD